MIHLVLSLCNMQASDCDSFPIICTTWLHRALECPLLHLPWVKGSSYTKQLQQHLAQLKNFLFKDERSRPLFLSHLNELDPFAFDGDRIICEYVKILLWGEMIYSKAIFKSPSLIREYDSILLFSFSTVIFWTHSINVLSDCFLKYWNSKNTEVDA